MTAQGIIIAIIAISVLIIVHEAGHYLVAKWCKMRVDRFSLGFGPALWGRTYKGTLFQIAPIPFGGFVEIRGMNIVEEVDPDDAHAYPNRPVWQRFLAIFAGPAANFLFAIVLAFVLFASAGIRNGNEWTLVGSVDPDFDAYGKLEPGDRILSLQRPNDPEPIAIYEALRGQPGPNIAELVHESRGAPMQIVVERGGEVLPPIEIRAKADPKSKLPKSNEPQYRMGIGLTSKKERDHHGFFTTAKHALYYPFLETQAIFSSIREMIAGREDGRLTGPVGIGKTISKAVEYGWIVALSLFMTINVWLGLVNLLPLPALDGGRLVFLIYEMATRRRPNPKIEATVHMVGIMLLLILMVVVTYNDCTSDFP